MTVEEEMELPNPRECLPIFLGGDGAKGPHFDAKVQHEKLAFFGKSPYEEHTSNFFASRCMSNLYITLVFSGMATGYFIMNTLIFL